VLNSMGARDQVNAWREFIGHPCWLELQEIARQQIRVREDEILGNVYSKEHELLKGERLGLSLFLALPDTLMSELEIDIANELKENEHVD